MHRHGRRSRPLWDPLRTPKGFYLRKERFRPVASKNHKDRVLTFCYRKQNSLLHFGRHKYRPLPRVCVRAGAFSELSRRAWVAAGGIVHHTHEPSPPLQSSRETGAHSARKEFPSSPKSLTLPLVLPDRRPYKGTRCLWSLTPLRGSSAIPFHKGPQAPGTGRTGRGPLSSASPTRSTSHESPRTCGDDTKRRPPLPSRRGRTRDQVLRLSSLSGRHSKPEQSGHRTWSGPLVPHVQTSRHV